MRELTQREPAQRLECAAQAQCIDERFEGTAAAISRQP